MNIKNYTPHEIKLFDSNNNLIRIFPPELIPARVSTQDKLVVIKNGIPFKQVTYGDAENLPPYGYCYPIVSAMVRTALPNRDDLLSPADLVRDDGGNIIGCRAFYVNKDFMAFD